MDRQALGTAQIIRGNALDLALADGSVDLIVTSPPYFGLRSYQDGGAQYVGQIGAAHHGNPPCRRFRPSAFLVVGQ